MGGAKILQKIMAFLSLSLRLLSIVTSGEEGGALGDAKILQEILAPPLSVIKIVKYCDVWGGEGALRGRQNPTKNNLATSLCH